MSQQILGIELSKLKFNVCLIQEGGKLPEPRLCQQRGWLR